MGFSTTKRLPIPGSAAQPWGSPRLDRGKLTEALTKAGLQPEQARSWAASGHGTMISEGTLRNPWIFFSSGGHLYIFLGNWGQLGAK